MRPDINAHSLLFENIFFAKREGNKLYYIISLINVFGFVSIVSNVKSQFYSFRSFGRFQINLINVCASVIMDDTHTHTHTHWASVCGYFPRALLFVYAQINQFLSHEHEEYGRTEIAASFLI